MTFLQILLSLLGLFNIFTFFLMAWDKQLAKNKKWRISENRFFMLALCGGSLGVLVAMPVWRHKNQKRSFKWRIYGIILLHIALLTGILRYL